MIWELYYILKREHLFRTEAILNTANFFILRSKLMIKKNPIQWIEEEHGYKYLSRENGCMNMMWLIIAHDLVKL